MNVTGQNTADYSQSFFSDTPSYMVVNTDNRVQLALAPTYTVTVGNGTGSGSYPAGAAVMITADAPESGKQFSGWTGTDGLTFTSGDASTATATFIMPANAVEVAAAYTDMTLTGIAITTPPAKTVYNAGQLFDPSGMVVTASYSDGSSKAVTGYSTSPSGALTTADTSVVITYQEGGVTKTASQSIGVHTSVITHEADITVIGQQDAQYRDVRAKLMPLGKTEALHIKELSRVNASSPEQYLYHETIADGAYNLIVTAIEMDSGKDVTVTTLIDLQGQDDKHSVELPEVGKNSIVADSTGTGIIAGKVDAIAAKQPLMDEDGHLEVTLSTAKGYDQQTGAEDGAKISLQAQKDQKTIEKQLDIDLMLYQYDQHSEEIWRTSLGSTNQQIVELMIPVNTAGRTAEGFAVYRVHNGELHSLPYGERKGEEFFTVDIDRQFIRLFVKRFSSYAIGYGAPQTDADLPQTGDDSPVWLWLALCLVSCLSMTAVVAHGKRRKTE